MGRSRFLEAALIALAIGRFDAWAQQPTQAASPLVTFRSGVELVRMDVQITDGQGRPVRDIRANEITITEDGQRRPVELFQHVEEPRGTYVDAARRTIGAEVSTNRGAPRGHLYVLVFDQHHISPGNEQRVRQAAERFLHTQVRAGDRVALYGLPGPGPLLPFTSDVKRAVADLALVRGSLERQAAGVLGTMRTYEAYQIARGNEPVLNRVAARLAAETSVADVTRAGAARAAGLGAEGGVTFFPRLVQEDARTIVRKADEEARRFLIMLTDLMQDLRSIEGRKAIILVSEGFFLDNVSRELERAAAAAARSYSVIYSLDINRRADTLAADGPVGADDQLEIRDRVEPLGSLAIETDGELVNDAGSYLDQVFGRIGSRSLDYYVVGFQPSERALARRGEYRRVTVSIARDDVRVSTRTGYALHTESRTPADRRRAIDQALAAPFPRQELPLEFTTYVLRGHGPGAHRVVLSLAAELPLASGTGDRPADVVFVVRGTHDGRVAASGSGAMPLPDTPKGTVGGDRSTYKVQFDLPAGEYLMRIVVREPGGLVGSADRRLAVPPLVTRDVAVSDLVLSSPAGELPVRPVAYTDGVLSGAIELYAPTAAGLNDVDVRVQLVPLGTSEAVTTVQGDLLEIRETDLGPSRPVRIEVPLGGVRPGEYVARALVRAHNDTVAERTREVEVLAGPRPEVPSPAPAPLRPQEVVQGEPARQLLRDAAQHIRAGAITQAIALALAGSWDRVEPLLPASADAKGSPVLLLRGLSRLAAGDFDAAARFLEACVTADPRNARVAFVLGWAHAGRGDDRQAIGAWRSAAYLDPALLPAHLALADAFVRLGEPGLARQAIRAGLSALPQSPELIDRLARLERR